MTNKTPHIVQYQGSKRLLAPQIIKYMPQRFNRLLEPFAGMAAISIAVAIENRTATYVINDINEPVVRLLQAAIETPHKLIENYTRVWNEQFNFTDGHISHYYHVREHFNSGEKSAENMLYLLARCVKGAVRYDKNGLFNQSPDKRRHGTNPKNIKINVGAISSLLSGRAEFTSYDYKDILLMAEPGDLVYMDPPYQGVTNKRDNRYLAGVDFNSFVDAIHSLKDKGVNFIISYDGECGGREYGSELPGYLGCTKVLLNAGRSTQATLLGKSDITYEALYMSEGLRGYVELLSNRLPYLGLECVG